MTTSTAAHHCSTAAHHWATPATGAEPPAGPAGTRPDDRAFSLRIQCHRRLRGPYSGAGAVLRVAVPELLGVDGQLVAARATEVATIAPELTPVIPVPPQTLTNMASRAERTRFYPATRTLRLSHGATELLLDWARLVHPEGVAIEFLGLDDADPTDREFVSVLLRRSGPARLAVTAHASPADDILGQVLARYAQPVTAPPTPAAAHPAGADLAQLFIDSDGTATDPAVRRAYELLPGTERAARHTARAQLLAGRDEPSLRLGAIPYHLEHGADPVGAGADAINKAVEDCFDLGCYEATLELALRGRELVTAQQRPGPYHNFTHKAGACLSYLMRGQEGFTYFDELRRITTSAEVHMNACYMMAMLYTRHLPAGDHDEFRALEWVNTAIAIADRNPDPHHRVFTGAFMRNARALVEMHRGDLDASLALVNEAIAMTDADLGPGEQLLHRSVLLYNRAQILNALGDHDAALLDYDLVISRDPEYGDYYFERAGVRRAAGRPDAALADYATSIELSPPFHEAHYNRADLLRELGDDEAALRDLDYAAVLDPDHVDTYVNRVDLLLAHGETERARADIERGLALDPGNANLLSALGMLQAEDGDTESAYASYTAALAEDPAYAAAWANRAVLRYSTGQLLEAVDDLDHAIRLADDPELRANRAIALQDLGDHHRALEDLDIAVAALADLDPELLYRRGASRHALHDVDGALADWQTHLAAYDPGTASPYATQIQRFTAGLPSQYQLPESVA